MSNSFYLLIICFVLNLAGLFFFLKSSKQITDQHSVRIHKKGLFALLVSLLLQALLIGGQTYVLLVFNRII
jgi:hypothetical protein